MTTDLVLTEFDRHHRPEISEIVEAVATDRKFYDLIQQAVDRSDRAQFEIFKQLIPKQYTLYLNER